VGEDAEAARRILLAGLAEDTSLPARRAGAAAPAQQHLPGEVFLRLAADALAWSGVSPADPLPLDGTRERFLPDYYGRGRDRRKLQFAILATAALHGGAEPDLYALLAAVRYIRAAAHRVGVPVRQACQELAPRSGRQPG
jgi:hypothetical protein